MDCVKETTNRNNPLFDLRKNAVRMLSEKTLSHKGCNRIKWYELAVTFKYKHSNPCLKLPVTTPGQIEKKSNSEQCEECHGCR